MASLPNSWDLMRVAVSNFIGNQKLKFNDIRDCFLGEEVRMIDSGEPLLVLLVLETSSNDVRRVSMEDYKVRHVPKFM